MKKIILASLAILAVVPSTAMAQPGAQNHHQRDARDSRHDDRREVKQDRHRDARPAARQPTRWDYRTEVRSYNRENPWRAAPFKYQRFRPGAAIRPAYFGRAYQIADYRRFQWNAPRVNERWVRHYDDALLVNTRSGRVVKVIENAFRNR